MSNSISLNSQNTTNYIDICKSELDPNYVTHYTNESNRLSNRALIYAVAFPVIIATSIALVAAFAPPFLIVTGFTALLLISVVHKIYCDLTLKSELTQERANQFKSIQEHHESLTNATPAQIQQMLKEKGIDFVIGIRQNDQQLATLKPVLARHLFWEERIDQLKKSQEKTLKQVNKLTAQNTQGNKAAISALQGDVLNLESQLVTAKVKCAFVNAALFNPTCKGRLEDLGTFSTLSGQERAVALAASASKANDFFLFNQPNLSAITFEDAKRSTIRQLGMRLYPNIQR